MPHAIETLSVGELTVRIGPDPDPPDPREWDNLAAMVCLHRRYRLGDSHDYRAEDHSGWAELEQHILRDHPGAAILPLFLFDHSGLTLSTTDSVFRACDPQGWDWGQVGFIYAPAEAVRAEHGVRRISRRLRQQVEDVLRSEVAEYDRYLRGEAYSYVIEDADGEVIDSCCGLLGLDHAVAEARAAAEALA